MGENELCIKLNKNIPIQLDSVCSTKGDFTPKWFRYENEEHEIKKVAIDRILSYKDINFVGIKMIQYICSATINEQESLFELRYNVVSHKWTFFQMLS